MRRKANDHIAVKYALDHRMPMSAAIDSLSQAMRSLQQYATDNDCEIDASTIHISSRSEIDHVTVMVQALKRRPRADIIAIEK